MRLYFCEFKFLCNAPAFYCPLIRISLVILIALDSPIRTVSSYLFCFFVVVFSSYLFCCYLVCCYLVVPTAKFTYRPFLEYWLLVSKTWFRECWTLSYGWYELRFAVQRKHLCKGSVKCYRYLWLKTIKRRAFSSHTLNKYPNWSYLHQSPRQ